MVAAYFICENASVNIDVNSISCVGKDLVFVIKVAHVVDNEARAYTDYITLSLQSPSVTGFGL